ncbi:S-adenosyl-L-methionine-dependent methyltransferase [Ephemerocybe angulata]|uniref:DNA (cytosine-5-)-methyltransferase n=1 Tax=Ephemerocybe angulata TaxID=980116 RepID=A0A8H6HYN8_9AGAR|nr:S-adenosyl-L-methionine-dependent methyltransferase [Tulosesus angulatus]
MPPRRQRPNAFEVSFPEEAAASRAASLATSSAGGGDGGNGTGGRVGSGIAAKRKNEEMGKGPGIGNLPAAAYYNPPKGSPEPVKETVDLALQGEDGGELNELPVRILTNFTIYDPKNANELINLDVLENKERQARQVVVIGHAKAHFDERDSEDEGQEEDLDEGGEGEDYVFLELSTVFRYTIDYGKCNDPMYVQTQWAWYILDMPSRAYLPFHRHFLSPKRVAQMAISTALTHPHHPLEMFLNKFTNTVDPFGHTYVEQDLWDSVTELGEVLRKEPFAGLRTTPLIKAIWETVHSPATKKARQTIQPPLATNQIPASRLIGNPDIAVMKAENQNATHVTPRIAALAEGLVSETLRVVGKPIPPPKGRDVYLEQRRKRVSELVNAARKRKKEVRWEKPDRLYRGSRFLKQIHVEKTTYRVGDVVLVANQDNPFWTSPGEYGDNLRLPSSSTIPDFFWFGVIISIPEYGEDIHLRWFEHGLRVMLRELAHEQQLFLTNLCGNVELNAVVGKVDLVWNLAEGKPIDFHSFYCNFKFDKGTGSFSDLSDADLSYPRDLPPPDNCPVCLDEEREEMEKRCTATKDDQRAINGFTYFGKKYHYGEFIRYYSQSGPADLGFITDFEIFERVPTDAGLKGVVTCRKVGRIVDLDGILPKEEMRDERHLYITDEIVKVKINDLLGVIYVPTIDTLQSNIIKLQDWVDMSPDHFYLTYSWAEKRKLRWKQHDVCASCWKDKIMEVHGLKSYWAHHEKRPLKTLDLFGGVGAFSDGLKQGSGALEVTHAIELAPSAAKTFKRNFPDATVYNQCANTMLHYTIKTWEGHNVRTPYQLFDENVRVPPPPKKGDIQVITAGFPCQAHSAMNMYKNVNDVKNNLVLNALSWVDAVRPIYAYFENVNGFLSHRLNGTQAGVHKIEGGIEMGGLKLLVRALLDMGYQVRYSLLQAAHYGTPQRRIRFFCIAAKHGHPLPDLPQPTHNFEDTALEIKLPYGLDSKDVMHPVRVMNGTALHHTVTVEDAIGDMFRFDWRKSTGPAPRNRVLDGKIVPAIECKKQDPHCGPPSARYHLEQPRARFQLEARMDPRTRFGRHLHGPAPTPSTQNLQHFTRNLIPSQVERVIAIPMRPNADYRTLPAPLQEWQTGNAESATARHGYKPGAYARLDPNGVYATIVTNVGPTAKQSRVIHPWCNRIVSVNELGRGQGFSDFFYFESHNNNVVTMLRQIGNAVPYPLGRALGRELRVALLKKWMDGQNNATYIDDSDTDSDVEMRNRSETLHSD